MCQFYVMYMLHRDSPATSEEQTSNSKRLLRRLRLKRIMGYLRTALYVLSIAIIVFFVAGSVYEYTAPFYYSKQYEALRDARTIVVFLGVPGRDIPGVPTLHNISYDELRGLLLALDGCNTTIILVAHGMHSEDNVFYLAVEHGFGVDDRALHPIEYMVGTVGHGKDLVGDDYMVVRFDTLPLPRGSKIVLVSCPLGHINLDNHPGVKVCFLSGSPPDSEAYMIAYSLAVTGSPPANYSLVCYPR